MNSVFKNKKIVIMGGGTAGWVSALYFLNKSKNLNLDLEVKLISSNVINPIGVGEGTTPAFVNFITHMCNIDGREFLRETEGSLKYGIKFVNWNFDKEYYYHLFNYNQLEISENEDYLQHLINNDLDVPQKILQKNINGEIFDLLENNEISLNADEPYAYHFSADLVISFLKKKCLGFDSFNLIDENIKNLEYDQRGNIKRIVINENNHISADFYVNCLGFKSKDLLSEEYFDIVYWDKFILNNSAFAIQVKNNHLEKLEPYTTSSAEEYGWSWKIPQYKKTGYGYVYSDNFINDENKIYDNLLKTYNIKEKNIFKTKVVKSKPYYNRRQIHKNCLSIGLSSGFIEPLEATSIHMSLTGLKYFFEMIENGFESSEKNLNMINQRLEKDWINVLKFIVFHYFTNNPINEYWQHYKDIQKNNIFNFCEKYTKEDIGIFSRESYLSVGLGMKIKDYIHGFSYEKYLSENIDNYLKRKSNLNRDFHPTLNEILLKINTTFDKNKLKIFNYK